MQIENNMKTAIQRALPHNDTYKYISSTYISLVDGGCTCDNCGKLIANLVTVENGSGKRFVIGSDCAETLTSLKNDFNWTLQGKYAFDEGKQLRAKLLKNIKAGKITSAYLYKSTDGLNYVVSKLSSGGSSMQQINFPETTLNYISELLESK